MSGKQTKKARKAKKAARRRAERERKARRAKNRAAKKEQQRRERLRRRAQTGQVPRDPHARKRAARRRMRRRLLALALLALLLGLSALLAYGVKHLPVRQIEVEGDTPYTDAQLLETAGLSAGQPLLILPVGRMERSLLEALPWLAGVDIDRRLPDRVVLRVSAEQPVVRIRSGGDELLVTAENRVVGESREMEEAASLPLLLADFVQPVDIAATIAFETENDSRIYVDIFDALKDNNLLEDTRQIDMQNTSEITVLYAGRFLIELGDSLSLDDKLRLTAESIRSLLAEDENAAGRLDASAVGYAYYKADASVLTISTGPPSLTPTPDPAPDPSTLDTPPTPTPQTDAETPDDAAQ